MLKARLVDWESDWRLIRASQSLRSRKECTHGLRAVATSGELGGEMSATVER